MCVMSEGKWPRTGVMRSLSAHCPATPELAFTFVILVGGISIPGRMIKRTKGGQRALAHCLSGKVLRSDWIVLHLHPTGWHLIIRLHSADSKAGKCGLYFGHVLLKILLCWKEVRKGYSWGDV